LLPPDLARYVEAVCYPELRCLNYEVSLEFDETPGVIRSFKDSHGSERENLREYFSDPARIQEEIDRIEMLAADGPAASDYFIFESVVHLLRQAVEHERCI
jgi:hypothetical protein